MISQVKSVIFDMDGVIIDTEPLHLKANAQLFRMEFNISISKDDLGWVGMKEEEAVKYYLRHFGLDANLENLIKKRRTIYSKILRDRVNPIPGSVELINRLKEHYRLALASSSSTKYVGIILTKLKIEQLFETIVTGDDVERGKPDPEIYLLTAERLKLDPKDCLAVEDSENGVKAAKNAGMRCIAVPNNFTRNQDFSRADLVANNLIDVYDLLIQNWSR